MAISVTLWRKTLLAHEVCEDGLHVFEAIARQQPATEARRLKRIRVARWTLLHQFWLCSAYPGFARWLRQEGLIPWIDASGANLSSANLSSADLSGADLYGADLYGADLCGAYRPDGDLPDGWSRDAQGYLQRST